MDYKIIRRENIKETPWAGGVSKELFIYPTETTLSTNFLFRVSSATVNSGEYKFSDFTGYNRLLVLLSGELDLNVDDKEYHLSQYNHIFFSGDSDTISLAKENCIDFNLIYKNSVEILDFKIVEGNLDATSMAKGMDVYYNLDGTKHLSINSNQYTLFPGDTLVACGNNFKIEGTGNAIFLCLKI
nr:HutD family protein [uncultured Cetobacterium sp.]